MRWNVVGSHGCDWRKPKRKGMGKQCLSVSDLLSANIGFVALFVLTQT